MFDKLGKGYIYTDELKQNLLSLGEPLPAEDIAEMIKVGCPTSDGRLNYYGEDYCTFHNLISPLTPKIIRATWPFF